MAPSYVPTVQSEAEGLVGFGPALSGSSELRDLQGDLQPTQLSKSRIIITS